MWVDLRSLWESASGGDVVIALTGIALADAQGSLNPSLDSQITGGASSIAQGVVGPQLDKALTGQAEATALGNLGVSIDTALTGLLLTLSQGTVTPVVGTTIELTGQSMTTAQGIISAAVAAAFTGQPQTSAQGSLNPSLDSQLSGGAPSINQGIVGPQVAIALNGQPETIVQGTITAQVEGDITLALTGQSMSMAQGIFGVVNDSFAGIIYSGDGPRKRRPKFKTSREEYKDIIDETIRDIYAARVAPPIKILKTPFDAKPIADILTAKRPMLRPIDPVDDEDDDLLLLS